MRKEYFEFFLSECGKWIDVHDFSFIFLVTPSSGNENGGIATARNFVVRS